MENFIFGANFSFTGFNSGMKIQNSYGLNFKSGLTDVIKREVKTIDTAVIENQWHDICGVDANFAGNKALAACFTYVLNICQDAFNKFSLPFNYLPPRIRVFKPDDLIEPIESNCLGFCITDTDKVLKNEPPFELCSVFLKNQPDDIEYIDNLSEKGFNSGKSSSSHFLAHVLHEWMHNIHLNLIFYKDGYDGKCAYAQEVYNNKNFFPHGLEKLDWLEKDKFTSKQKKMVKENIGSYAATSKIELFPEVMVKLITGVIDADTMTLKQNPLDSLKTLPKFVQSFIRKELD